MTLYEMVGWFVFNMTAVAVVKNTVKLHKNYINYNTKISGFYNSTDILN